MNELNHIEFLLRFFSGLSVASDLEENLIAELAFALRPNLVDLRQLNLTRGPLLLLNDFNWSLLVVQLFGVLGGQGGSALLARLDGHIVICLMLNRMSIITATCHQALSS